MNTALLSLFFVLAQDTVRTDYSHGPALSREDETQVLALARQVGMTDVATITTHSVFRNGQFHIEVRAPDRVDGRKVSYQIIRIVHEEWADSVKFTTSTFEQVGPFIHFETVTETRSLLRIGEDEYLIELDPTVPVASAEFALSAFLSDRIEFGGTARVEQLAVLEFEKPFQLFRTNDHLLFIFRSGQGCSSRVEFSLIGNRARILEIGRTCA